MFYCCSTRDPIPVLYPFHICSITVPYPFHICSLFILFCSVNIPSVTILYPFCTCSHSLLGFFLSRTLYTWVERGRAQTQTAQSGAERTNHEAVVPPLNSVLYIPLTNRVRGPYRKLRTEFFAPRFMAHALCTWEKTRIRNLQYGLRKRG